MLRLFCLVLLLGALVSPTGVDGGPRPKKRKRKTDLVPLEDDSTQDQCPQFLYSDAEEDDVLLPAGPRLSATDPLDAILDSTLATVAGWSQPVISSNLPASSLLVSPNLPTSSSTSAPLRLRLRPLSASLLRSRFRCCHVLGCLILSVHCLSVCCFGHFGAHP